MLYSILLNKISQEYSLNADKDFSYLFQIYSIRFETFVNAFHLNTRLTFFIFAIKVKTKHLNPFLLTWHGSQQNIGDKWE